MSRSILLPLLALGGLILFGTTRAARPSVEPERPPVRIEGPTRTPITERAEPERRRPMPPPPPAPRLRSELEPDAPEPDAPAADSLDADDPAPLAPEAGGV